MQLASSTIKKVTLELGGKSPNIVFDDADMDQAVDGALWATFFHQGQVCESGTRLLLPESIHDEFVERLVERGEADQARRHARLRVRPRPARVRGAARHGRALRRDRQAGGREGRARRQAPRGRRLRARLLVRADDLHRGRQLDDDRPGGDLRAGAVGDQVQGRRRRDPDRQRDDLRPRVRRLVDGPRPLPRDGQARCRPARSGSTTTT